MRENGRMTEGMVKVRIGYLLIVKWNQPFFDALIGKWFGNNGNKYEGEWKDDKMNGQGNKKLFIESKKPCCMFQ